MSAIIHGSPLIITRVFDAPRELVFDACTDPKHLVHWFGQPKGATMPVCKVDLRVDGVLHYCVLAPDGQTIWGKGFYREIRRPEKLVLVSYFSDPNGNIVDVPGLPHESIMKFTFDDVEGKTRLTVQHDGVEQASPENQSLYKLGWNESLDRLTDTLWEMS